MQRKLVLVVEDNEAERELYGKLLWYNGFDVAFAADGDEGFRLAQERRPDLVLLDLVLPGVDGIELCNRLKAIPETAGTPVMMLTGRPSAEMGEAARRAGCIDYLEKPIPPFNVLRRIEELVGAQPPAGIDDEELERRVATPDAA